MSHSEDAQPNEVRHARKGNAAVPVVQTSRAPASSGGQRGRGIWRNANGRGFNRGQRASNNPTMRGRSPGTGSMARPRYIEARESVHRGSVWHSDARGKSGMRSFMNQRNDSYAPRTTFTSDFPHVEKMMNTRLPVALEEPRDLSMPSHIRPYGVYSPSSDNVSAGVSSTQTYPRSESLVREAGYSECSSSDGLSQFVTTNEASPIKHEAQYSPLLQATFLPDPIRSCSPRLASETNGLTEGHPTTMNPELAANSWFLLTDNLSGPSDTPSAAQRPSRFRSGTLKFSLPAQQAPVALTCEVGDRSPAERHTTIRALDPAEQRQHSYTTIGMTDETMLPHSVEVVQLRMDSHDKPRRLFVLPDSGILTFTMRGSIDLVEPTPLRCTALLTATAEDRLRPIVDDVCCLPHPNGITIVLGRAGDYQQLSLSRLRDKRVEDLGSFPRPSQTDRKGGISVVSPLMRPDMFVTGGYDHIVHTWTLTDDDRPTSSPLAIRHSSAIYALHAVHNTSHKLITGSADCSVTVYDIASERVVNTLKLSNAIYQVHPALSPFCTLLEIGHRELQFEIRDYRVVPSTSVIRFGYPNAKVHGRFTKGAVHDSLFACGGSEKDGSVRVWDLRKPSKTLRTVSCFPGRKATQVVFDGMQMIACSEDRQLVLVTTGE